MAGLHCGQGVAHLEHAGVQQIQGVQDLRLGEHGALGAAELGQVVMGQNHVLQHQQEFRVHPQLLAGAGQLRHPLDQVAQQLPLQGIFAGQAHLVGAELGNLAQVVKDHPGGQQVGVQVRIDGANGGGGPKHGAGVVQKPAALGVVQLLSGGVVVEPIPGGVQPGQHQLAQALVLNLPGPAVQRFPHDFRGFRGAGDEQVHVHRVLFLGQAHLVHPELGPVVVFQHHAPHLDHRQRLGRGGGAVPHLGVHLAGTVGQGHVQVFAAVGGGALLGGLDQQETFEHLPA